MDADSYGDLAQKPNGTYLTEGTSDAAPSEGLKRKRSTKKGAEKARRRSSTSRRAKGELTGRDFHGPAVLTSPARAAGSNARARNSTGLRSAAASQGSPPRPILATTSQALRYAAGAFLLT